MIVSKKLARTAHQSLAAECYNFNSQLGRSGIVLKQKHGNV